MKACFSKKFIAATEEMCGLYNSVPSPYIRKSIYLEKKLESAYMTVCGLGFYRLFLNGKEYTKGALSPYITNPDNVLDYDEYSLTDIMTDGKNVFGFQLGNGMQNCYGGFVWDFDEAKFRSAPKLAVYISLKFTDGTEKVYEADESFVCHPSPIIKDDLRMGEVYDANAEIPNWCEVNYDDSAWTPAISVQAPHGTPYICVAKPIITECKVPPVSITAGKWTPSISKTEHTGYIYDFGANSAGTVTLRIKGKRGQKVTMTFAELIENGEFYTDNISFIREEYSTYPDYVQQNTYILKGSDEIEEYTPSFTYHGFRYVFVEGIDEGQATKTLLTYNIMHTELSERGSFTSSSEKLNRLQAMTRASTLSGFWHFPVDCPQREKNGWTADAALSAEHTLINLDPYENYREWMRHICHGTDERGALPGIIPTGGWGFHWGNGPAWDQVIVELPYMSYRYTGRREIVEDSIDAIIKYVHYLDTRKDERGLLEIGLGDWCAPHGIRSPLIFTDSVTAKSICDKAAFLAGICGRDDDRTYCEDFSARLKASIREHLIDLETGTAIGECQTSAAMAIYYGIIEGDETERVLARLLEYIKKENGHLDTGVLGGRVIFHVLAEHGYSDLAYDIITEPSAPSYGQWLELGYTTLAEDFYTEEIQSKNHHFWGDISAFFIKRICGINYNPDCIDHGYVKIKPHFLSALTEARAHHDGPRGRIEVEWRRDGETVILTIKLPEDMRCDVIITDGYRELSRTEKCGSIEIIAKK